MPKRAKIASDSEDEPLAKTKVKLTNLPESMAGRNKKRPKKSKSKKATPPASGSPDPQVEPDLPTLESIDQDWLQMAHTLYIISTS